MPDSNPTPEQLRARGDVRRARINATFDERAALVELAEAGVRFVRSSDA